MEFDGWLYELATIASSCNVSLILCVSSAPSGNSGPSHLVLHFCFCYYGLVNYSGRCFCSLSCFIKASSKRVAERTITSPLLAASIGFSILARGFFKATAVAFQPHRR